MDEAYVVLVADRDDEGVVCQAFPFATKHAAEQAGAWLALKLQAQTLVIDDHEPEIEPELAGDNRSRSWDGSDLSLDELAVADLERERGAAGLK